MSSPAPQAAKNNGVLIPLYATKLKEFPDVPKDAAPAINHYFRELMDMTAVSNSSSHRTAEMDAYFKKLKFLLKLPDGTKTLSTGEFLEWLEERPKICGAYRKFIVPARMEMIMQLEEDAKNAHEIGQKYGGFAESEELSVEMTMLKELLVEVQEQEMQFRARKEELMRENKLFLSMPETPAKAADGTSNGSGTATAEASASGHNQNVTMKD